MARLRRTRDERGGSNALAALLLTPVVMFAILGTFQAGVWYHGRNTALHAAQAAAEAERVLQPAGGAGQRAAESVGTQGGLTDMAVSVSRSATTVTVTMTARVPMFINIGVGRFTEHVTVPRERLTCPAGPC
jgi:hypothetical protein